MRDRSHIDWICGSKVGHSAFISSGNELFFSFQLKSSNVKIPLYLHGGEIRVISFKFV